MNSGDWNAVPQFAVLVLVPSSLRIGDSVAMISSETIDKICGALELVCDSNSSNNAVSDARERDPVSERTPRAVCSLRPSCAKRGYLAVNLGYCITPHNSRKEHW